MQRRKSDLVRFYSLLERLEKKTGDKRTLSNCNGRMEWPQRGVYFFMEPGEERLHSGYGMRVVRVGTHALKPNASSTLWQRLSSHKGTATSGGGNHRGSIFRLLVGETFLEGHNNCPTWGIGNTAKGEIRLHEEPTEKKVSAFIGSMPFLFLDVDDEPGADSMRGCIERNSIALLSNFAKYPLDPPSTTWRGKRSSRPRVQLSGLWNQNHVEEEYSPEFLNKLEAAIDKVRVAK